ncbi:MAG TPA: methylated-DNA--[protein]-cysteine S-methyltransferase [Solirubrobacteraceae bacterium]|nr:methylated-DNA--[protein]-cysteine S-methyltransferase [Solirubrobacteraceae bacterium]
MTLDEHRQMTATTIARSVGAGTDSSANAKRAALCFETALGTCALRWSELGISEVVMPGARAPRGSIGADSSAVPESVRAAVAGIVALLEGERRDLRSIVLDERRIGSFRRRVYAATRAIAAGATAGYGEIARAIGAPEEARAVGTALGENPFPIIVPCHRVLAANGALHGFSAPGGIATKRRMLEIECAPGFTQQALFG